MKEHITSISGKRDKPTLQYKRRLADAFEDPGHLEKVGLNKRFRQQDKPLYAKTKRAHLKTQKDIREFFEENAVPDPCKMGKKKQLVKLVKELHKEFVTKTKRGVSLRSFHRHKPKNMASGKRLKFRQFLCEVCLNPKLKLERRNRMLARRCERVVE